LELVERQTRQEWIQLSQQLLLLVEVVVLSNLIPRVATAVLVVVVLSTAPQVVQLQQIKVVMVELVETQTVAAPPVVVVVLVRLVQRRQIMTHRATVETDKLPR
jgi:uncharacterized membrane protein YozB (DUF420 family)